MPCTLRPTPFNSHIGGGSDQTAAVLSQKHDLNGRKWDRVTHSLGPIVIWACTRTQAQWRLAMINEWAVAFPYTVWLAGVAPDKENISCEYLCSLFKAKARCLHKVIRLYIHTGRQEKRGKEKHVNIRQQYSPLILTSHMSLPFSTPQLLPPLPRFKQFSSLVTPSNSLRPDF